MAAWLALIDPISRLIDKIIPDPKAREEAKLALMKEQNAATLAEIQAAATIDVAQLAVNQEEAKNENMFISGWRPAIGWVCATAFAYKFVLQPFLIFSILVFGVEFDPKVLPMLDWAEMTPVLMGILGLGYLRTQEKIKG